MRIHTTLMAISTTATALLVATLVKSWKRMPSQVLECPASPTIPAGLAEESLATEARPELSIEPTIVENDHSEKGGPVVVLALFGLAGALGLFAAAFIFPTAFVAAGLTFGAVSILGLIVLYVHFKAHASDAANPMTTSTHAVQSRQVDAP